MYLPQSDLRCPGEVPPVVSSRRASYLIIICALAGCSNGPAPAPTPSADDQARRQHEAEIAEERTKRLAAEGRAEAAERERDRVKRELDFSRETSKANDNTSRVATKLLMEQAEKIRKLETENAALRGGAPAPVGSATPAQPSVPIPSQFARRGLDLDRPVAVIDGEPVSTRDFVEALYRTYGLSYLTTFENLVLVEREARRLVIDVSPAEEDLFVDSQLAGIARDNGGDEAFQKKVESQGMTIADVRGVLKANARHSLLIEKLARHARVTPEGKEAFEKRVRAEYEKHFGEKVQARDIYVRVEPTAPAKEWELAEKRARALHKRLVDGEDFERVAKESSDEPRSKSRGGDLGTFGRSQYAQLPELNKVLFDMPVGEVSAPVKTEVGFHIVQVVKHVPAEKTFESARQFLADRLEAEGLTNEENDALIATLRARAKIEKKMEPPR